MAKRSTKRTLAKRGKRRSSKKRSTPTKPPVSQAPDGAQQAEAPATPPPPPDPHAWRTVDRDQLADLLGVHPDSISDFTREGMPVVERGGRGAKSVYDAVNCLAWWRLNKTNVAARELAQARAFAATAELSELKTAERKGELVPRDQVVREGQSYTKAWAARVHGLPRQLLLAGIITREQESRAAALCRDILTEIASWRSIDDTEAARQAVPAA